jgi:L-threonylcarbamoyladenylate synthase
LKTGNCDSFKKLYIGTFERIEMADTGQDIGKAVDILNYGGLVAIPTETVYGLAANGLNSKAVAGIFAAKKRPSFNPLILHSDSLEKVASFTKSMDARLLLLAEKFWPGPLTLILEKKFIIPDLVTAGLNTVAVRLPRHPLTRELLHRLNYPLAAPSANPFGYVSPTTASHVENQLGEQVNYILDGGPCDIGIESTILGIENDQVTIYRLGGISLEEVEEYVASYSLKPHSSSKPVSPGMLSQHYSPGKKVLIGNLEFLRQRFTSELPGILAYENPVSWIAPENQFILSPSGDLREAAARLFAGLRYLDKCKITVIFAELLPERDLGRAINDRLKRAAAN